MHLAHPLGPASPRPLTGLTRRPNVAMAANTTGLVCLPSAYVKTLYIVRHGEAWSNLAATSTNDHSQYLSEEWFDASLSPTGWKQAEALNAHVKAAGIRPQLVVVSPLTRALQTAAAAFGSSPSDSESSAPLLMVDTSSLPGKQTEHAAISSAGAPPFLALELSRERLHGNPCDRRRPVAVVREGFPGVDWSFMTEETDVLWQPEGRETQEAMQERGARLLRWLLARPETEIAVVSHSGLMHATLVNFLNREGQSHSANADLDRWFENCELRTVTLLDPGAAFGAKHYADFPGGDKSLLA